MSAQTVNHEVTFEVPEGYRILDQQEKKEWNPRCRPEDVVLRKPAAHSAMILSWKKTNLLNRNMPLDRIIEATGGSLRRHLPAYRHLKDVDTLIAGKETKGFRYSYEVQGSVQMAEYLLVKHKGVLYAFVGLSAESAFEDNYPDFEGVLGTVRFETGD